MSPPSPGRPTGGGTPTTGGSAPERAHRRTFVKHRAGAPAEYYQLEAAGLRWLAAAGCAAVPSIVAVGGDQLVLQRIELCSPGSADASRFGAELAQTHRAGATAYGSPPPTLPGPPPEAGFIADLELPFGFWDTFGPFYAQARLLPYLQQLEGRLNANQRSIFTTLIDALRSDDGSVLGPAEPPSRLHGDLWSGNVVWGPDADGAIRGWLIDPAAHGGHRETDLAMLALFGAPHLDTIFAAYHREYPLSPGWRERMALHQVHPLLVHAVLFGGGYLNQAATAARLAIR